LRFLAALIWGDLVSFEIILDHSKFVGKIIWSSETILGEALGKSSRSIAAGFTFATICKSL
jgi:hypothetical protein